MFFSKDEQLLHGVSKPQLPTGSVQKKKGLQMKKIIVGLLVAVAALLALPALSLTGKNAQETAEA